MGKKNPLTKIMVDAAKGEEHKESEPWTPTEINPLLEDPFGISPEITKLKQEYGLRKAEELARTDPRMAAALEAEKQAWKESEERKGKPHRQPLPGYTPRRVRNPDDPSEQRGIGLRRSEWTRMGQIAEDLGGESINSLATWALRDFIRRWDAGERPEFETSKTLKR